MSAESVHLLPEGNVGDRADRILKGLFHFLKRSGFMSISERIFDDPIVAADLG